MAAFFLLFSIVCRTGEAAGDIFASSGSLAKVFKLEHEVVKVLDRHRQQLETSLQSIRYS